MLVPVVAAEVVVAADAMASVVGTTINAVAVAVAVAAALTTGKGRLGAIARSLLIGALAVTATA